MTSYDAAVQITLKAMELGHIQIKTAINDESEKENVNAFNAKQISNYLEAILNKGC